MKHRKLLTTLTTLLCFSMLVTAFSALTADAAAGDASVQNGTGKSVAIEVGNAYSYRAHVNGSFDAFTFTIPTFKTTASECTLSLYKWEGDYESTIAKEPLVAQRFTELKDGAANRV